MHRLSGALPLLYVVLWLLIGTRLLLLDVELLSTAGPLCAHLSIPMKRS